MEELTSLLSELLRVFPHYWVYITTAQSTRKDCRDRPYVYSVLTVLHSAFSPKVTQMRCHHSRQMDPYTRREIDGRLSITQAQTPTGTTFQVINIYQFTAANPTGQTDVWTTTENWINKQKNIASLRTRADVSMHNKSTHGKARSVERHEIMCSHGTTTSHPRPPDQSLSPIKNSTTAKYGPSCPT